MPLALRPVFNMGGFSGLKRAITGDEFNPILEFVKSCRRSGFQTSGRILCQKKVCWISRRVFVIATS